MYAFMSRSRCLLAPLAHRIGEPRKTTATRQDTLESVHSREECARTSDTGNFHRLSKIAAQVEAWQSRIKVLQKESGGPHKQTIETNKSKESVCFVRARVHTCEQMPFALASPTLR